MKQNNSNAELKNLYLFIIGQFVSQFGSKMTSYGLILWVYQQTGSALSTSLLTICTVIPSVSLSFIAGSISDKWNKKKIMLFSDSIAATFSLCVIILLLSNQMRVEYIYVINVILGIADSFQNPAYEVSFSLIVTKENYMKTSGLRTFCYSVITIFAPIVTTSVYAFLGIVAIVTMDLATFIFAFVTLLFFVTIPEKMNDLVEQKESVLKQCKFGIQYIIDKKGIFYLILFMAFVNFVAAIYNSNLTPMILSRNGNNKIELGIVSSSIGIAGLIGSILVTKVKTSEKRITLILNIMSFSFLVCNTLMGVGRNYYVWTFAVFAGNCLVPFLTANVEYIMRTEVPLDMQGRVFAARNTLQYGSIPLGYLVGGILADKVFEPLMNHSSSMQKVLSILVGSGKGSGIAVIYILIALLGFLGCCLFRFNKELKVFDKEQNN
jgi:hypothetical protein